MAEVLAGGGLLWAKVWGIRIDHAAPAVQWVWGPGDVLGDIMHLWIVQVDGLVQMLSRASFSTPGGLCVANAWECVLMAGPEEGGEEGGNVGWCQHSSTINNALQRLMVFSIPPLCF